MIIQSNDTLRILMIAEELIIAPEIFDHPNFYDAGYDEGEMKFKVIFNDALNEEELQLVSRSVYYRYNAKRYGSQKYEYVFDYPDLKGTKIIGRNHRHYVYHSET